jgi:UDP-N-acetylmuramoyl-L-alanyl-D-glutamate--2,6-diaminopimelate ligase
MEVSSHAIEQYRVSGTRFTAGVFTNLSQDHLDYHGTMDSYFEAKARLFARGQVQLAVVNRSNAWGARLAERLSGGEVPVVTFAPDDASDVVVARGSTWFTWRGQRFRLNLMGRFNIANAIAAATTASELGAGLEAVTEGLASVRPVRGRFELVDRGQPFSVLVDFAHTPGALAAALEAARELARGDKAGRLLLVFGAGGDRDRAKRPLMGRVAGELADVVVITSDNPRHEDPLAIVTEVLAGVEGLGPLVDLDRARAISSTIAEARPGDVVLY